MGLFEDFSKFLETRLEEFLGNNPGLELEGLLSEIQREKANAIKSITKLEIEIKQLESEIVSVAQDIKKWHGRIETAKAANRLDLVKAAQERETALLRLGNLVWKKRANVGKSLEDTRKLLTSLDKRQKEVKAKIAQMKAQQKYSQTSNVGYDWNSSANSQSFNPNYDDLEAQFQQIETDEELAKMKKNLNL